MESREAVLQGRRRALSVLEIVVAAVIIGLTAIPILELIRSSTASLEVNQTEAAARRLAADVLERYAGPPLSLDGRVGKITTTVMGVPTAWDVVIKDDPALARHFPEAKLAPLLNLGDVRVLLKIESPFSHPALAPSTGMDCYRVTVSWKDRDDRRKEVTYARLLDRR